jgi:hypothetical protein
MDVSQDLTSVVEEEVKEIAKLLSKAAKNYQMYLSNNRMFISSLDDLKSALDRFLEDNEVLTFVVKEFELLHRNVPVYTNTDKFQSVAFRMYRDGVRLLSFHRGIGRDELIALFEALTKCMEVDNLEEDFVTLLWEKDLESITYYEVNDFEADADQAKKGDHKKTQLKPDLSNQDLAQSRLNQVSRDVERLKPTLSLTAEDLQEVQDLAFAVEDDFFLRRAWQVFALAFETDDSKETYCDLENGIVGFLDTCMANRQIGLAAEALATTKSIYESFDDKDVSRVLRRILTSRHSEKNMGIIEQVLATGKETDHFQCAGYLSLIGAGAIPSILRLLPVCTQPSAKRAIIASVAALGEACPSAILESVDTASSEDVEVVLDILEAIGTEAAFGVGLGFSKHHSARVRGKVASMAGGLKGAAASAVARTLVNDTDDSVRRKAVVSMVKICGEGAVETLAKLFTSKEFSRLSHDSKLSMLIAIRNLPSAAQMQAIRTILKMRAFLRRRPIEDTKIALIEIMHLMDQDVAFEVLDVLVDNSSGKISKAARATLKKVRDADRTY